jgi:hypothetical protein
MQDIEKEATAKDNTATAFSEMNSGFFNTTFAKLQTFQRVAPKGKAQNVILLS